MTNDDIMYAVGSSHNRDFLCKRWVDLCGLIERTGRTIQKWYSEPRQHDFREADDLCDMIRESPRPEQLELIRQHDNADRELRQALADYENAQDDEPPLKALAEQKHKDYWAIDGKLRQHTKDFVNELKAVKNQPLDAGWHHLYPYNLYYIRGNLLRDKGDLYIPRGKLIFPSGLALLKDMDGVFLVDCAVLSVAYNKWITQDEPPIYDCDEYKGKYFHQDTFIADLRAKGIPSRIQNAWRDVKDRLPGQQDYTELSPEAKATAVFIDSPDITMVELARITGLRRSRLYRMPNLVNARILYKDAQAESHKDAKPAGEKDGETGKIEAWKQPEPTSHTRHPKE